MSSKWCQQFLCNAGIRERHLPGNVEFEVWKSPVPRWYQLDKSKSVKRSYNLAMWRVVLYPLVKLRTSLFATGNQLEFKSRDDREGGTTIFVLLRLILVWAEPMEQYRLWVGRVESCHQIRKPWRILTPKIRLPLAGASPTVPTLTTLLPPSGLLTKYHLRFSAPILTQIQACLSITITFIVLYTSY